MIALAKLLTMPRSATYCLMTGNHSLQSRRRICRLLIPLGRTLVILGDLTRSMEV
jgi:hypothetical protein